jgi:hypothetical protein
VVNQVEKIFIYNKKLLNKEQKKNLFLFSLEVLEQLVNHDYIKQELVETTGHLGERLVAAVGAEQHEEDTLPKKKTNKQAAYKTFFNYKLKAKIELPLNFSY